MSLYSAQVITDCMKVKNCGVRMASSDITFIQTGSITPRQSACHYCMQTGGKMPLPTLPQYPVHTKRGGLQIRLDIWRILTLSYMELRFLNFLAYSLVMKAPLWRKKLHRARVLKTCFMTSIVYGFEC